MSENKSTNTRRRGEALENDILQAAWDELNEVGYNRLTMEAVALRAKTNKTAVYRRWPGKSELVVGVLHKFMPKPVMDVPDTGNLREDVLTMLRRVTQPLQTLGAETIHGLMVDRMGNDFFSALPNIKHSEAKEKWNTIMMAILKNAEQRGEASLKKIRPRVVLLPVDLILYEFLTTYALVSDETVIEIVDTVFLPLVGAT